MTTPLTTYDWLIELAALECDDRVFYVIAGVEYRVEHVVRGHYTIKNWRAGSWPLNFCAGNDTDARKQAAKALATLAQGGAAV